MYILGPLEDQLSFFIFAKLPEFMTEFYPYNYLLRTFLNPLSSSEPFTFLVSIFLKFLFGFNYLNIFILLTIITNVIFSYLFFKKYTFGFLYTFLFSLSSYFLLHLGTHMSLSQVWILPAFLLLNDSFKDPKSNIIFMSILMILFFPFSVLVSNYLGFFLLIYFVLDNFYNIFSIYILERIFNKKYFIWFSIILLLSSLLTNYRKSTFVESRLSSNLPNPYRTLEDFFYFSSRPWYFLIPSPKNIFYGEFSSNLLSKIKDTGYFLADDYFAGEHSASFFGYFLLLTFFSVSGYILFRGSAEQKTYLSKYWLINIALFLLMMPPYFTINGFKIYTPGYLVYEFFPMFRTTVRMSILILLNILLVLAMFFNDLYIKLGNDLKKKAYLTGFLFLLTGITLFETFIPIKIQHLTSKDSPSVYSFMGENHFGSNFVVYPYSRTNEAVFWVDVHKSYLVNPRMYSRGNFNSESFTKSLNTPEGIKNLSINFDGFLPVNKVDYLVVFKDSSKEDIAPFFNCPLDIILEREFEDAYLFKVLSK